MESKKKTRKKKLICGRARGGRADERVENDSEMNRQIDEDDEERDGDGPTPSKITDRHGDRPVNQSVSHIHSWPHYSAPPHPDMHKGSSVCLCVCVCLPTEPLAGSLDQLESQTPHPNPAPPCMSDTGAMMAHQPPKDSTATQKICLLGDEGSGSVASEKFLFRKASFNLILALMSRYHAGIKTFPLAA